MNGSLATNGIIYAVNGFIPDFIRMNEKRPARSKIVKIMMYSYHDDINEMTEIEDMMKGSGLEYNPMLIWENDLKPIIDNDDMTLKTLMNKYTNMEYKGIGTYHALDIHEVSEYYDTHSRMETCNHFNIDNENNLRGFLKYHGIQRRKPGFNGDSRTLKNKNTALKAFHDDKNKTMQAHLKAKKAMKARYDDEYYNFTLMKQTMMRKYGVEHGMQLSYFKDKSESTMLARYGVTTPLANADLKNKFIDTCMLRYNAVNPLSNDSPIREVRNETMIAKYGTIAPLGNNDIYESYVNNLQSKYGVINPGLIHADDMQSNEELMIEPLLSELGFIHNDLNCSHDDSGVNKHPLYFYMPMMSLEAGRGKYKCPDYVNYDDCIVIEYNGSYWHDDANEPSEWLKNWNAIGYDVSIIWDFELEDFTANLPVSIHDLLIRYPCTFRRRTR